MAAEYELLMRKSNKSSVVKSSMTDFGFVVCDIVWPPLEIKELASRSWPGEQGDDVYTPKELCAESYDLEVHFCYKGERYSACEKIKTLRDYLMGLDGDGAALMVYDPYNKRGRQGVYLTKIEGSGLYRSNIDEVLEITATFRVSDPITEITLKV